MNATRVIIRAGIFTIPNHDSRQFQLLHAIASHPTLPVRLAPGAVPILAHSYQRGAKVLAIPANVRAITDQIISLIRA